MFTKLKSKVKKSNLSRKVRIYIRDYPQTQIGVFYLIHTNKQGIKERKALGIQICEFDEIENQLKKMSLVEKIRTRQELLYLEDSFNFTLHEKHQRDLNLYAEMQHWAETQFHNEQTKKNVLTGIFKLKEILGNHPKTKNQFTKADIVAIRDKYLSLNISVNTARTYFNVVRRFFSYQFKIEAIDKNPCDKITIKEESKEIEYLDMKVLLAVLNVEVGQLRDFAINNPYNGSNDTLKRKWRYLKNIDDAVFNEVMTAFKFTCFTGFRPSDIKRLKVSNVKDGFIYINTKKTNTIVNMPIPKELEGFLKNKQSCLTPNCYLFNLPRSLDVSRVLKGVSDLVGITTPLQFRIGRRTFACMLAQNGVSPMVIAKLMGHSKSSMTEKYYAAINDKSLTSAIDTIPTLDSISSS